MQGSARGSKHPANLLISLNTHMLTEWAVPLKCTQVRFNEWEDS